jgi:hypothetical protein
MSGQNSSEAPAPRPPSVELRHESLINFKHLDYISITTDCQFISVLDWHHTKSD